MKQRLLHLGLALAIAAASAPSLALASSAPSGFSIDSKVSDLLANPAAVQVLESFVQAQRVAAGKPELTADQKKHMIDLVRDFTPREIARIPQVHLDDKALAKLNTLLAQLPTRTAVAAGDPPNG